MNDKTAKLIRKYANRTEEDQRALTRRWLEMTQDQRRRFRQRMLVRINKEETEATSN